MVEQSGIFKGYVPFTEEFQGSDKPQGLGAAQPPVVQQEPTKQPQFFSGYAPNQNIYAGQEQPLAAQDRTAGLKIAQDYKQLPWGEAALMAGQNLPTSMVHNIKDLYETGKYAIQNPEEFGAGVQSGLGNFYRGFVAKGKGKSEEEMDPQARAALEAAQNYAQQFTTEEGLKKFLVEKPADVAALASPILTGTGSMVSKVPVLGLPTVGKAVTAAGELADPILGPVKAAKLASEGLGAGTGMLFSLKSGASFSSLKDAAEAGATANPKFLNHLVGSGNVNDISDAIVDSIRKTQQAAHEEYKKGRGALSTQTDLPFNKIDEAIQSQYPRVMNKNGIITDNNGHAALAELENKINEFKAQPPGSNGIDDLDRLKRYIDDMKRANAGDSKTADLLGNVRKSVYDTMYAADPNYAKVMSKYGDMMDEAKDIKNAFLRGNINSPNAIATLKSAINSRDKGYLKSTWDKLIEHNPDIPYMVAAQELRNTMPVGARGMVTYLMSAGMNPAAAIAHVMASSPNVAGLTQYGIGLGTGAVPTAALEASRKIPYLARMGTQMVGEGMADQAQEANRPQRASGGRIGSDALADKLVRAAEMAKKSINSRTEHLLNQPDESIAKALDVAKRHI